MGEPIAGNEPQSVEALPYEPLRDPPPGRHGPGKVMAVGFVLVLLGFVPGVSMFVATDQIRAELREMVVGVLAALLLGVVGTGLFLILSAAREMLRR
jgi:hypothetical protein